MTPRPVCNKAARLLAAAALGALLGGCYHTHHHGGYAGHEVHEDDRGGPPPWAPAHGHRRKHETHHHHGGDGGVQVVFDSAQGVSVVVGFPLHYFDAGYYYRLAGDRWEVSAVFEGPWVAIESGKVPEPMRRASKKSKKGKKAKHARWAPYWD